MKIKFITALFLITMAFCYCQTECFALGDKIISLIRDCERFMAASKQAKTVRDREKNEIDYVYSVEGLNIECKYLEMEQEVIDELERRMKEGKPEIPPLTYKYAIVRIQEDGEQAMAMFNELPRKSRLRTGLMPLVGWNLLKEKRYAEILELDPNMDPLFRYNIFISTDAKLRVPEKIKASLIARMTSDIWNEHIITLGALIGSKDIKKARKLATDLRTLTKTKEQISTFNEFMITASFKDLLIK